MDSFCGKICTARAGDYRVRHKAERQRRRMETNSEHSAAIELWSRVLSVLKRTYDESTFNQWFGVVVPLAFNGSCIRLGVNDDFFAEWLDESYGAVLAENLNREAGSHVDIIFEYGYEPTYPSEGSSLADGGCAGNGSDGAAETADAERADVPVLPKTPVFRTAPNCLARHTFDCFVVGEENRYAFSAAKTAAQTPGVFNPLFIYGGTGMGKTHLIQAVANAVQTAHPNAVVRYTTCEGFLNDYVESIKGHTHSEFRDFYRNVDLLLVDDVHQLGGKQQLQEEFFNTFNTIYNAGKQIMLTSDTQPSEINGLEARLVSRFESGVAMQLTVPSYETRLAILKMKQEIQADSVRLSDPLLSFIAEKVSSHVRALEGALMRLVAFSSAMGPGTEITLSMAESLLSDILDKEADQCKVSVDRILKTVSEHFNIPIHDIIGTKRPKNIAEPRMVAMYLSRTLTDQSLKDIGLAFGGRNHTTVIHAVKQIEDSCTTDETLKRTISSLKRKLHNENR